MITLDNSKERNRIKSMFDEGELKYNKGSSYSEKEEGVTIILKGLRLLKNLYETRIYLSLICLQFFFIR